MADIGFDFNSDDIDPNTQFDPLPPGDYVVQVISSEKKATKNGNGAFLSLGIEVLEPAEYEGRRLFDNINMWNPNPQTVEIAKRHFSGLVRAALGGGVVSDTEDLHFTAVMARIAVQPPRTVGDKTYDASNVIKGYSPVAANQNAAAAAPARTATPAAANRNNPPPAAAAAPARAAPWGPRR